MSCGANGKHKIGVSMAEKKYKAKRKPKTQIRKKTYKAKKK